MKRTLKKGFTLVEMMIVVVVLGILIAIAIPSYNGVVENSRIREFEANHNMIVSAINMYTATHNGAHPTEAAHLDAYLYNDSGATTSLDSFTKPDGATYQVTFGADSKVRPTLISTYKAEKRTFNAKKP